MAPEETEEKPDQRSSLGQNQPTRIETDYCPMVLVYSVPFFAVTWPFYGLLVASFHCDMQAEQTYISGTILLFPVLLVCFHLQ